MHCLHDRTFGGTENALSSILVTLTVSERHDVLLKTHNTIIFLFFLEGTNIYRLKDSLCSFVCLSNARLLFFMYIFLERISLPRLSWHMFSSILPDSQAIHQPQLKCEG